MTWFSAHIIIYVRYKEGIQDMIPIWENIHLIESESVDEAYKKAEDIGKKSEGDSDGTFMWGNIPSIMVFGGIRKLIECQSSSEELIANPFNSNRPTDGSELSYSQFFVKDEATLNKLIQGESTEVIYSE